MTRSCVAGLSEEDIDKLRERIPSRIETQMAVIQDEDHPDNGRYQEKGGSCDNSFENHFPCMRLKNHKGKSLNAQ